MFAPRSAGALGQLRVWAGGACRARRARSSGSAGSEPEAPAEWALRVSPFGRLRARLPCRLAVRPLDPLAYPDGDRVLVAASAAGASGLRVAYDEALREVAVLSDSLDPRGSVEVAAPLHFDLNIKSSGSGCVKVQNFECDNCKIETEQGTSILQSLKSQKLHVQTKGGKVICLGTIYGNIDIHASDKSTVTIDKLQGSSVSVSTEDGLLKAKYLYTDSSFLSSAAGDITLGSVHGDITLHSKMGNITVGSIVVKVASSLQAHLQLSGKEVDVNSEVHVQEMAEARKENGVIITGLMNQASTREKWIKADAPQGTEEVRKETKEASKSCSRPQFQHGCVCVEGRGVPPHHLALLGYQLGVLQFNSILTLSTQREHQIPQFLEWAKKKGECWNQPQSLLVISSLAYLRISKADELNGNILRDEQRKS
nr:protein FAM185A isoform X2 [Equus caballus]